MCYFDSPFLEIVKNAIINRACITTFRLCVNQRVLRLKNSHNELGTMTLLKTTSPQKKVFIRKSKYLRAIFCLKSFLSNMFQILALHKGTSKLEVKDESTLARLNLVYFVTLERRVRCVPENISGDFFFFRIV